MLTSARFALLVTVAATMLGCVRTETYQLAIKNATAEPITLWLTKDGPPAEAGWRSPEQLAMQPVKGEKLAGALVEPGELAMTGPRTGHFDQHTQAWLRIYGGAHTLSELLAISRGSPNRLDEPLEPGQHAWTVVEVNGALDLIPGIQQTAPKSVHP
jgi:hypothetical protein